MAFTNSSPMSTSCLLVFRCSMGTMVAGSISSVFLVQRLLGRDALEAGELRLVVGGVRAHLAGVVQVVAVLGIRARGEPFRTRLVEVIDNDTPGALDHFVLDAVDERSTHRGEITALGDDRLAAWAAEPTFGDVVPADEHQGRVPVLHAERLEGAH